MLISQVLRNCVLLLALFTGISFDRLQYVIKNCRLGRSNSIARVQSSVCMGGGKLPPKLKILDLDRPVIGTTYV